MGFQARFYDHITVKYEVLGGVMEGDYIWFISRNRTAKIVIVVTKYRATKTKVAINFYPRGNTMN